MESFSPRTSWIASGRHAALLCFLALAVSVPANAQESAPEAEAGPETDYTLTFAKVNGQPGTEVSVAVLFARKTGTANVSTLQARLRYPGGVLQYVRIEDAYLSKRVKMQFEGKETPGSGGENQLDVSFSLPDSKASFPSGQIATIFFKIADGAPDGVVALPAEASIDGKPVLPDSAQAKVEPGHVNVSKTPVFVSCFFFTH
jgi:hypothetical protein